MAITVTGRGSYGAAANIGNGGTFATSSFTPSADCLLLAFIGTQGGPGTASNGVASISGHGTWNQLTGIGDGFSLGSNDQLLEVWYCFTSSSPSASAVTATNTTQTKIRATLSVMEVTGTGIDSGSAITDIVLQLEHNSDTSGSTSGSVTLASFADATNNAVIAAVLCARYQETISWDTALNSVHRVVTNTELMELGTAQDIGEDTSPGWTWSANNRTWRAMALEISEVAGDVTASPGVLARSMTLPAVTASTSETALPEALTRSITFDSVTVTASAVASPTVMSIAPSLLSVALQAGSTVSPGAFAMPITLPAVTASADASATATPGVLTLSGALPGVSVLASASAVAPLISRAMTFSATTQTASALATPATVARSIGLPSVTRTASAIATPSTIAVAPSLHLVSLLASSAVTPDTLIISASLPAVSAYGPEGPPAPAYLNVQRVAKMGVLLRTGRT